jgi:hypothetical protein
MQLRPCDLGRADAAFRCDGIHRFDDFLIAYCHGAVLFALMHVAVGANR